MLLHVLSGRQAQYLSTFTSHTGLCWCTAAERSPLLQVKGRLQVPDAGNCIQGGSWGDTSGYWIKVHGLFISGKPHHFPIIRQPLIHQLIGLCHCYCQLNLLSAAQPPPMCLYCPHPLKKMNEALAGTSSHH